MPNYNSRAQRSPTSGPEKAGAADAVDGEDAGRRAVGEAEAAAPDQRAGQLATAEATHVAANAALQLVQPAFARSTRSAIHSHRLPTVSKAPTSDTHLGGTGGRTWEVG